MAGRKNRKSIMISNSDSIRKSPELSMAKLNQGLTLNQMQLLAYAIYATQQDGSTTFQKSDFEKKFDIQPYKTERAREDAQKIISLQASIMDLENDYFEYLNIFRKMKYDHGTFRFEWDHEIVPHILDLKDKYVRTDLKITAKLNSSFSWTLYEYMKANYGSWYRSIGKNELMRLFGVENKKTYIENTGKFKQTVLDKAILEINKYTEIEVKYEDIKEGRSIIGFKILWSTGTNIHKASKKQVTTLKSLVNVVFEDVPMYLEIKDEVNREKALSIIRELQSMKYTYLDPELGLTADHCRELARIASDDLEALNSLLEMEGKKPLGPQVPLFNWLIDK